MNTILRVYDNENNEYDLDLFQDQDFLLDISAKEAGQIPEIFGISSQNIILPATNNNNDYFGNLWNLAAVPSSNFTRTYPCQVLEDGDEVFTGKIFLESVVTDQRGDTVYNVIILDEVVDFKSQIANLTWKEVFAYYTGSASPGGALPIPVNAGWNHTFNYVNVSQSWDLKIPDVSATASINRGLPREGDIVYPLVEYGSPENSTRPFLESGGELGTFTNITTPMTINQFKPAIRMSAMFNALMRFTGYEYTSSFIDSDYFDTIYYLTTANEDIGPVITPGPSGSFLVDKQGQSVQDFVGSTNPTLITFTNEVFDNANKYDTGTSQYTCNGTGNYTFRFSLDWQLLNKNPSSDYTGARIDLYINGALTSTISPIVFNLTNRGTTGGMKGEWNNVYLQTNDTVELRLRFRSSTGVAETLRLLNGTRTFFECTSAAPAVIGATIDMSLQFGDEKVVDWLTGVIQKFNLVIEPLKDQKNVLLIEPFDIWRDLGTTVDWTDIVDRDIKFKIQHPVQQQPKEVYFSDEEDTDEFNRYSIDELDKTFGSVTYTAEGDVAQGEQEVGTFFAPTPMKYIQGSNLFIIPQIYTVDNGAKRPLKFKPRMLHYVNSDGVTATPAVAEGLGGVGAYIDNLPIPSGNEWYLQDESGTTYTMAAYPQFHHINELPADNDWSTESDPSTTRDLHFGNRNHWEYHQDTVNAQTYRDALEEYWSAYLNELYDVDARLLTCNIVLNPVTISQIQLNDKIFIDGHYYRINKINGASLTVKQSTEVELLKAGTRRSVYPRRRVVKNIGGGGTGGSTGGGQGVTSGEDFVDDIIIGEEFSSGKVVYVNYNTGDVVTDYDLINLSESMLNNNFIVSLNNDGEKNLTNVSGGVILNPIKPISGSQYSDKVVAGNFISQGTASFEDSIVVTGSIILNGTSLTPIDTGSFESKTRFNHAFAVDPTTETFTTVLNMVGANRGAIIDYVLFSGSATTVGQLQITADGVSSTAVDKIVERVLTGAPTGSFTAAYNTTNVDVKATFIGSNYTISGSVITMI
jgi:hypothetical protein